MNPEGNIYRAPEDEIPAEDKARLEGYLIARAEMDEQMGRAARIERLKADLALERKRERGIP